MNQQCPDGGTCHHKCTKDYCFRVDYCEPLAGIYSNNTWPDQEGNYPMARKRFGHLMRRSAQLRLESGDRHWLAIEMRDYARTFAYSEGWLPLGNGGE